MSFKNLKEKFDVENIENLRSMDAFERLCLQTMFEINGNLDTLALASREAVKLLEAAVDLSAKAEKRRTDEGRKATSAIERFVALQEKAALEAQELRDRWATKVMESSAHAEEANEKPL